MNPYAELIREASELPFSAWDIIEEVGRVDAETTEHIVRTVLRGLSIIATGICDNECSIVEIHTIELEQLN